MIKKGKFGKFLALICSLMAGVMIFSLAACNDDGGETNSLKLNKDTLSVAVGGTEQLSVTSSTTENIEWTIDKTSVATVKGSGAGNKLCTVTGVAEGTATVTAKAGDQTATCAVTVGGTSQGDETVTIKLGGEEVGTDAYNLYGEGDALTFTATASKGSAITWESSDPAKATVSNGKVTAVAAGDATITAKVSDSVKASVNVKVLEGTTVNAGSEDALVSGWCYFAGESDANVASCVNFEDKAVKIKYSWSGGQFWNVQLFFKNNLTGKDHGVTFTLVAPSEGKITVNSVAQELVAGANAITVESYTGSTLSIQFGVDGDSCFTGQNLEFLFKDIVYTANTESALATPSFSYDEGTKVVTITDTANGAIEDKVYQLGFFESATAADPVATVIAVNGEVVDLSKIAAGTYTVRIRAYSESDKILNSGWSETTATITSENSRTDLLNNQNVPGKWAYFFEAGKDDAYLDANGNVIIKNLQAINGEGNWWGTQVFYTPESGKTITGASFTITAKEAGFITAHLEDADHVYELNEDNQYTVTVNVTGLNISGNAAFKIFMCKLNDNSGRLNGDITLSNIKFTYAD